MPFIDVSDLLSDPEVAGQSFTVIREVIAVGNDGQTVTSTNTTQEIGSVLPAKSEDLQMLPEGSYQKGALKIRTAFRLSTGGDKMSADIIRWPAVTGPRYQIKTTDDWSQFGKGFITALATLADINPAAIDP